MKITLFLKGILLVVLLGCSCVPSIAAENRLTVAVYVKVVGESTNAGGKVADALRAALIKNGNYIVVERNKMKEALKQQHQGRTGESDQDAAKRLGKILMANRVAMGSVADTENGIVVNIRFVDVDTGEIVLQKKLTAQSMEDIPDLCGRLVAAFSKVEAMREPEENESRRVQNPGNGQGGHWALGGFCPGASLKYVTGGTSAWELRGQSGSGILALGPRYYIYLSQDANPRLFFGVEGDYITFKSDTSKGSGFAGGAFAGGEVFLSRQIGLMLDVGPMYINLAEDKYSQSAGNMEYVLNAAIYWHFR